MSSKSINNSKIMSKKKSIAYKILICALFSVIGIVLIIPFYTVFISLHCFRLA